MKMKTILILLLLTPILLFAGQFDAKLLTSSYLTDDNILSRGTSIGLELSYTPNDKGYFFLSNEVVRMQPIYKDFYYNITGVGVGSKIKLTKSVRMFSQLGYYFIKNSIGDRVEGDNEAIRYFLNNRFVTATGAKAQFFDAYGVENDNAVGATIGLEFDYPLTKKFNLTSTISYRLMKFKQTLKGFRKEWDKTPHTWWEAGTVQDFSSLNMGVGINYNF